MSIIHEFMQPGVDSRGMFRCWFPDAGADLDRIGNHVKTIFNAGFGGMEIAMVPQYAEFDPREYGWATPRWKEMLRRILQTAVSLPEPFKIDLTITAHWPPALNTIDPNHPAAQKELRYTVTKVTRGGTMELPLPETRICDDDAGDCMVVSSSVNGQPLPPVNQRSGRVDLTGLVHAGENTLELEIATTLINRLRISHPLFDGKGGMPAPPAPSASENGEPPMMGNLPDGDYELPSAPMDMPAPRAGEYHYGIFRGVVTPFQNR